jgi:hypothetical protein
VPPHIWDELVCVSEGDAPLEPLPLPWWERMTPLANDCEIALELLHCTPREYYLRTSVAERFLLKIHLAYRQKQRAMAEQLAAARSQTPRMW